MTTILVSLLAACVAAAAAYLAVRRALRNPSAVADAEARLSTNLLEIRDSVGRWREESRSTIQEKMGELYEKVEQQNRSARGESRETLEQVTRTLTERFEKLQESNEKKLTEIRGEVEQKLEQTRQNMGQTFQDVVTRLAELHETNRNIMQFSQDLHELQNILKAPRLRGEVGEVEMERLLRECLAPAQFDVQHELDGNRVDAVILNPNGKLPVDSKFPLEAWRRIHQNELSDAERNTARKDFARAVKSHMEDIARKYIRPPKTLDMAVMYVPAEGVYYELMENPDLTEHARKLRVFPASPTTFWALLQVTVIGFRGLQLTEHARHMAELLNALSGDLLRVKNAFNTATKQLGFAKTNMDEAAGHLDRFDVKFRSVQASSDDETPPELQSGEASS